MCQDMQELGCLRASALRSHRVIPGRGCMLSTREDGDSCPPHLQSTGAISHSDRDGVITALCSPTGLAQAALSRCEAELLRADPAQACHELLSFCRGVCVQRGGRRAGLPWAPCMGRQDGARMQLDPPPRLGRVLCLHSVPSTFAEPFCPNVPCHGLGEPQVRTPGKKGSLGLLCPTPCPSG